MQPLRMLACAAVAVSATLTAPPLLAGPLLHCTSAIVVNDTNLFGTPGLAVLDLDIGYPTPAVEFVGAGAEVECELGGLVSGIGATPTFFDDDAGSLRVRYEADLGVPAVQYAVAVCRFDAAAEPAPGAFSVLVNEAKFPDGSEPRFEVGVAIGDISCDEGGTTTTTTTATSSTTTLPGLPACADVNDDGRVTATDCLAVLRRAVSVDTCVPECVCDTDGNGTTTASDALLCLREATQPGQDLSCPCS